MEVVAKTGGGFLISATESEIKEIVNAVTGSKPKDIEIGQKIPAIDYASTITKIKSLKENHNYTDLMYRLTQLNQHVQSLKDAVDKAAEITI
jgi:hypothetical protein